MLLQRVLERHVYTGIDCSFYLHTRESCSKNEIFLKKDCRWSFIDVMFIIWCVENCIAVCIKMYVDVI